MRLMVLLCIALLVSCSGIEKKVYPKLAPLDNKISIDSLWVAKVGEKGPLAERQLSIELTDDLVYLADARGRLIALKQDDGRVLWKRSLGVSISSGPKVDGDILFIGNDDAELYALDVASGNVRWKAKVSSELLSEPVVYGKYVIVQTIDGKLTALNRDSGARIWADSREVPALTLRGTGTPIITNQHVVAGFANGKLAAFEIATGSKVWESTVAVASGRTDLQRMVDIDGLLASDNKEIYAVSYQGRIAAVSALNGQLIWSREMSSYAGITMDGQQLYVTDTDGHVWAIDRRSGATLWRQDSLEGRDVTGPAVVNNTVAVADGAGYVHWLSREDGAVLGRKNLLQVFNNAYYDWGDDHRAESDFGVSARLKVSEGRLFVRNNMGALSVFKMATASETN